MNRSSSPKGAAPRITKPVHVRGESLAEAPAAFLRDDEGAQARMPVKTPHMPMFAPVTGPRLTPEEAPGKPSDWTPHRPDRPEGRKHIPFRLETKYTPAGDQPAAIAELVATPKHGKRDQVLLEPIVRPVNDLIDRKRSRGPIRMIAIPGGELFGDLSQPFIELGDRPCIQGRERSDDARLALGDDQSGIGNNE